MNILQFTKLFFIQGGFFMYPILMASIFGLAIIAERFYKVVFQFKVNSKILMNKIFQHVKGREFEQAIKLCGQSKAPLPLIIKAGLEKGKCSQSEFQNAIDEAALEQLPRLSRRIEYLSMVANISTLMGLLGTIQGLIQAFQAVSHVDAAQKATLLAGGISMALNTTAFGLVVAIPCMISYSILNSLSDQIVDDINEFSLKFINLVQSTRMEQP